MTTDVVPPIIRVPLARWETSQELNRAFPLTDRANWTWDHSIAQLELAKTRLLEACAAGELRMIVCDPATGSRHVLPIEYFHTDEARIDFEKEVFHGYVLTDRVARDPVYLLVKHLIGWPHVFLEPEFRKWLNDPEIGPQAGPRLPRYWTVQEGIEGISDNLSGMPGADQSAVSEIEPAAERAIAAAPSPSRPEDVAKDGGPPARCGQARAAAPEPFIPKKQERGPPPTIRHQVRDKMLVKLRAGEELPQGQQEAWARHYGVNRETYCRARDEAREMYEKEQSLSE